MNLVAKEYIASKTNHRGVLILSETAGAAEELTEAILVNPAHPNTLVKGLSDALSMRKKELTRRITTMQNHLEEFTVQEWASSFVRSLRETDAQPTSHPKALTGEQLASFLERYHHAKHRVLLLDYDGVLAPFRSNPASAGPAPRLIKLLKKLAATSTNHVIIISGRDKQTLESWFGTLAVTIVAEHGAIKRTAGTSAWQKLSTGNNDWQTVVMPILEKYSALTQGSTVEQKEWSIVWHYRRAKTYYAQKYLVVLKRVLFPYAKQLGLTIEQGNMILEIRTNDISKGNAARALVTESTDFALVAGDDYTDEDMFTALPAANTIKIGRGKTQAHYRLRNTEAMLQLLEHLVGWRD
jgi:trehalose 6-phosphate synthase/phosphatase